MREAGVELAMQHLKQRALFCVLCFFLEWCFLRDVAISGMIRGLNWGPAGRAPGGGRRGGRP